MSASQRRWKKAVKNLNSPRNDLKNNKQSLQRTNSVLSTISMNSIDDEETNKDELDLYLNRLKEKTGVRRLWSGRKFSNVVDDDKTPDISISSDDNDAINAMDFNRIKLDSDEDEMRIDYMRDVNNNEIQQGDEEDVSESLDLMNNIHFAELNVGEVNLSDTDGETRNRLQDDFLPNVYTVNFSDDDKESKGDSHSDSYGVRDNIKFMSSIESVSEGGEKLFSIPEQEDDIKTESVSDIRSILSEKSSSTTKTASSKTTTKSSEYSDDFLSSRTSKTKSRKKSNLSTTKMSPTKTSLTVQSHGKRKNKTKYNSSQTRTSSDSDSDTLSSTSSLGTDSSLSKSSHNSIRRKHSKTKTRKSKSQKSIQIQTDHIPNANDILNFKYPWQQDRPHNIASHVVDSETIHVLTSYEPSVLAAHDMMKYHFKLLQQHIDNTRRLYESYTNETSSKRYRYTTIEDTLDYIKRNRPKVLSYEEALRKVKIEEN